MAGTLREDADFIIHASIEKVLPTPAVRKALEKFRPEGKLYLVAVGKAAWQMAYDASAILKDQIEAGIVLTKHGHTRGPIPNCLCLEGGHPVPDQDSFFATEEILNFVRPLKEGDHVLFLLSGGGSSLFEKPLIEQKEYQRITSDLLKRGADIKEINTVRKHLSAVKGGRFAKLCAPAKITSVILSDVLNDQVDMIASGPACPDSTTAADAERIVEKYDLKLSEHAHRCLREETPKELSNVHHLVIGSVKELCAAAEKACHAAGYEPVILTEELVSEAKEAGRMFGELAIAHRNTPVAKALIAGGETVVHVTGSGLGGRNQELALSAAVYLSGMRNAAVFSIGSDGTDGPTDAAGGYVDGETIHRLEEAGMDVNEMLANHDSYHALKQTGGLIKTGPTGTNVNDVAVLLIRPAADF